VPLSRALEKTDPDYPDRLKDLAGDAPDPVHALGDTPWPPAPAVTIVGARSATRYGRAVAARVAARCALKGVTVVSGLALGIDGAAHRAALARAAFTVAVLGTGIDRPYPPEHASLYTAIARTGRVLSPWPGQAHPMPYRFPARNRALAALGDVTVVVQADARSGSRHTALAALALGRIVRVAPWPLDHAAYAGNAEWARDPRVRVLADADEAPELARAEFAKRAPGEAPRDDADRLALALTRRAKPLEELARSAGLAAPAAAAAATALEIAGRIERAACDRWRLPSRRRD
jgi:DNA processing protein